VRPEGYIYVPENMEKARHRSNTVSHEDWRREAGSNQDYGVGDRKTGGKKDAEEKEVGGKWREKRIIQEGMKRRGVHMEELDK
jgi:hypothetical protein